MVLCRLSALVDRVSNSYRFSVSIETLAFSVMSDFSKQILLDRGVVIQRGLFKLRRPQLHTKRGLRQAECSSCVAVSMVWNVSKSSWREHNPC